MPNNLSIGSGTILMITTMMGSGVIMIPKAMKNLGFFQGPLILGLISGLCFFTLYAISEASFRCLKDSKENNEEVKLSYYAVTKKYSYVLAMMVDAFIAMQGVGSCFVYLKCLLKWSPSLFGKNLISNNYLALIYMIPLYGLSMLKDLSALKHISKLSVASVLYLMLLMVYYALKLINVPDAETGKEAMKAFEFNYGESIGAILFALGCHQNIVQVFKELEHKSQKNITFISLLCILGGAPIYAVIGMCGYYVAGHKIKSSIFEFLNEETKLRDYLSKNSYDTNLYAINVGMAAFMCVMFCAFPMQMHPARDSFTNLVTMAVKLPVEHTRKIVTTSFCVFVCILAVFWEKNYDLVIDIIGATATNGITYIIPSFVYWLCVGSKKPLGVFSLVLGASSILLMGYLLSVAFKPK